jgi:hypothetical protein
VEEFVACGMHPVATSVGLDKVVTLVTPVSKLRVPLPKFVAVCKDNEDDALFLDRVEREAEGIMGSYTRLERDACVANLGNRSHLNRVFELAEVVYGPRLEPGTEEFTEALKKEDGCSWEEVGQTCKSAQEEEGGNQEGYCATRKNYYFIGKDCCVTGKRWSEVTVRHGCGFGPTS